MAPARSPYSRRNFIGTITRGAGYSLFGMAALQACGGNGGTDANKDTKNEEKMKEQSARNKLGIALVGLGKYSTGQLAPALKETKNCFLAGIVTGTPEKTDDWKRKHDIPESNVYNYTNFDSIKDNKDIDIVYVVLPNSMHAEYVIRAAKAGKHVICEKPMAITVDECDRMIAACKEAGKRLSIGYRLHFEPHNREMMRLGTSKAFGNIKTISAQHGMGDTDGWRLDKALAGGGPLMDVGIYCVQGARYTTGLEPIAVTAKEGVKTDKEKFRSVEESLSWTMEFPGGIEAGCMSSYSQEANMLRADAEKGWFELSPAYAYEGIKGKTSGGKMDFPKVNQQAKQMDDFAEAIMNNRPTPVPGEMGRQDVKILQAIYEAMRTGKRVEIS
jgi:predicted dehydrogenase